MSFFTILETLLIGPLKLLFEIIFQLADRFVQHPGVSIIFLSLIMNILVLPLYKRADAMQEEARDIDAKLNRGVSHIKRVFSGDEKMMILQTYYRQNNYKPTDALNGSVSLLLEIPFFMAAYQFLSHLDVLNGVSLGPIRDLSAPDGLIVIGGLAINLLPILMTAVNVISSALYLKGFPLKTKIQLYGMAAFFLVFLYTSPSGLVFYWTLNNVFSLVKTIFYKIKNPGKVIRYMTAVLGIGLLVFCGFFFDASLKKRLFLGAVGLALLLPLLLNVLSARLPARKQANEPVPNRKRFVMGGVFLTVLIGFLIPATFIAASPQEYVDITYFHNPLWYLVSSGCMAGGFFLVWLGVFYWLANPKGKVIFEYAVWIFCGAALVNYMFFGTDLGLISASLQYENGLAFKTAEVLINLAVMAAVAAVFWLVIRKWSKVVIPILLTGTLAFGVMSTVHVFTIKDSVDNAYLTESTDIPQLNLSKDGKNVVVLMLDRAMGTYVPYLFNEKPELKEQFAGFTYYPNTISFGGYTNFAVPSLLGGYEYTPVEMNKRDSEPLGVKHNEALKVMPTLFSQNDYRVTVCDPIYANYSWIPDLSVFDDMPGVSAHITNGKFSDPYAAKLRVTNNHRNFFCFSTMKVLPVFLQGAVYDSGRYNQAATAESAAYSIQTQDGIHIGQGLYKGFMDPYNVLLNLPTMTQAIDGDGNTFLFLANDATHEPMLLQTPDYTPAEYVDNTEYDTLHADRFTVDGKTLSIKNSNQMIHYHANMAALSAVGDWLDYLRQNGVYDNTRIIVVSDHGRTLYQSEELLHDTPADLVDADLFHPLLMVKDFGSTEFTVSDEFMTNADVPTLAMADLIENPVNPFTGNAINSEEKTAHDQMIILSEEWDIAINNGNTYLPARWGSVSKDLFLPENWSFCDESLILDAHKLPNS